MRVSLNEQVEIKDILVPVVVSVAVINSLTKSSIGKGRDCWVNNPSMALKGSQDRD